MKKILLIFCLTFLTAYTATAQKPRRWCPVNSPRVKVSTGKTTTLNLHNTRSYELDYVQDRANNSYYPFYCYGNLEAEMGEFNNICEEFITGYKVVSVMQLYLLGDGRDICYGETVSSSDIKGAVIYYIALDGYRTLDYINFETGEKTSRKVSNFNSPMSLYYAFEVQQLQDNPLIIEIKNKDFNLYNRGLINTKRRKGLDYRQANRS